jgi:hypothetical protein
MPDSTPQPQPAPPHHDASYGVVEPTDGRGLRFVAWAASPDCVKELCAVARKHGHKPTHTDHFLTESKPH